MEENTTRKTMVGFSSGRVISHSTVQVDTPSIRAAS